MNIKIASAITLSAAALTVALTGCTASDEPALEKGQPVNEVEQQEAKPAAPQECLDAISDAEEIDDLLSQGVESASRSIDYALEYDLDGLDEETAVIEGLTDDVAIVKDNYLVAAAVCETSNPPEACTDALRSGENVSELLADVLDSSSRVLGYTLDYNGPAIDEETELLKGIQIDLDKARADFDSQSTECESGV